MAKYQGIESKIDPAKERDAIERFLDKYWNVSAGIGKLSDAIDYIIEEGIKDGISLQEKEVEEGIGFYNHAVEMAQHIGKIKDAKKLDFKRDYSEKDIATDFSSLSSRIENELTKRWAIDAKPKDYDDFKKKHGPDDFADLDEKLDFDGAKLHLRLSVGCPELPELLKKGHVYYSEESQGRPPLTELVGAVLRQGINIGMFLVEDKYGSRHELYMKGAELMKKSYQD